MQDAEREPGEISPADLSPELSKHFRALRMWLPLMLLGTRPFRAALEEKLLLARYFHAEVAGAGLRGGPAAGALDRDLPLGAAGAAPERDRSVQPGDRGGVRRDGRVFLSSTLLDGRFTLRMAALAFRTHRRTIDLALRVLGEQVAALGG